LPSFRAFQIQVVYICAELYQISTGTPASRGPSAIAGLLVPFHVVATGFPGE